MQIVKHPASFHRKPHPALRLLALGLPLLLAACATRPPFIPAAPAQQQAPVGPQASPEQRAALQAMVARHERLYRVAGPLLVKNPELCKGNARNLLGFTAKNKYSYTDQLADAAQAVYGLSEPLQVVGVLAGSGAERAGIRRGDIIQAVEGKPLPQGPDAERQAAAVLAPLVGSRTSLNLTVLRSGVPQTFAVPLTRACAYSVDAGNTDAVNAYHDGQRVLVTNGMLDFARSDEELAYVLAKEMAHNSLRHPSRLNQSGTLADIIDNLSRLQPDLSSMAGTSGVKPMPKELDAAADTLSLYMLARAGYSVDGAYRFWQRLAAQHPATELNGYTALHPATDYRLTVMEKIVMDVKARVAGRQPLLP